MAKKNELEGDIVREFFDYLLKRFPVKEPVVLVRRKNLNAYGYYSFNGDTHYVTINNSDEYDDGTKCDFCCHEVAHCLDIKNLNNDKDPHSDRWGVLYSRCYRAYLDFLKEKEYKV